MTDRARLMIEAAQAEGMALTVDVLDYHAGRVHGGNLIHRAQHRRSQIQGWMREASDHLQPGTYKAILTLGTPGDRAATDHEVTLRLAGQREATLTLDGSAEVPLAITDYEEQP